MQSFEQLILLMGNMIAQIASEMVQLASGGGFEDFGDADVWQNWRGDIMTTLLDAWSLVLNDPLMEGSRHSHSGGRSGVAHQLKAALQEVSCRRLDFTPQNAYTRLCTGATRVLWSDHQQRVQPPAAMRAANYRH
jgi:hypothetical protein